MVGCEEHVIDQTQISETLHDLIYELELPDDERLHRTTWILQGLEFVYNNLDFKKEVGANKD